MNTKLPPQGFKAARNEKSETLELDVYDIIGEDFWGEGVTAKDVLAELKEFDGKNIHVRINSLGGDVYDGIAIYNLLRDCSRRKKQNVVVDVDGIAASAASVIACGGDTINVAANAMMMAHNAWTIAVGDAEEMTKTAEFLDKVNGQIAVTYHETVQRMGKSTTLKQIRDAMNEETWMTAVEAVEFGIASHVTKATQAAASALAPAIKAMPETARNKLLDKIALDVVAKAGKRLNEQQESWAREWLARATAERAILGLDDEAAADPVPAGSEMPTIQDQSSHQPINIDMRFGDAFQQQFIEAMERVIARDLTPAQSGPTTEEPIMSDKILKALGARDEEQALQLIELSTSEVANGQAAATLLAKFEELTGAKGDAALGAVAAWKADHEALPTITAERDELKGKVDARDKADADAKKQAVLDQIFNAGKATRAELELMKGNTIEYLESWLQNAAKRIPGAGEKPDDTEPQISSLGNLSDEERRHIKDLGITPEQWVDAKDFQVGDEPDDDEDDEAAAE